MSKRLMLYAVALAFVMLLLGAGWSQAADVDSWCWPDGDSIVCGGEISDGVDLEGPSFPPGDDVKLEGATVTNPDGQAVVYNLNDRTLEIDQDSTVAMETPTSYEAVAGVAAFGEEDGQIINKGEISMSGTGAKAVAGIVLGQDSEEPVANKKVHNDGTITVDEWESSEVLADGITARGSDHSVTNDGKIRVRADDAAGISACVCAPEDEGNHDINNDGHIHVTGRSYAAGILADGVSNTVTNAGLIEANIEDGSDESLAIGIDVWVLWDEESGLLLTNSGDIVATGGSQTAGILVVMEDDAEETEITNEGSVDAEAWSDDTEAEAVGIILDGSDSSIDNQGSIFAVAVGSEARAGGISIDGDHNGVVASGDSSITAIAYGEDSPAKEAWAAGMFIDGDDNVVDQGADLFVQAYGEEAKAAGIYVEGDSNWVFNGVDAWVEVEASGSSVEAAGTTVDGDDALVVNRGLISVDGVGDEVTVIGMHGEGDENRLINAGALLVTGYGEHLLATGMYADGNDSTLGNAGFVLVSGMGDDGHAAGMSLNGTESLAWNTGSMVVLGGIQLDDEPEDVATILASVDELDAQVISSDVDVVGMEARGEDNLLLNAGGVIVAGTGEVVYASGMGAIGDGNSVINIDSLMVLGTGDDVDLLGMYSDGDESSLVNTDLVIVGGQGEHLHATGMLLDGDEGFVWNSGTMVVLGGTGLDEDSEGAESILTLADASDAEGEASHVGLGGIHVHGDHNRLLNTGQLIVRGKSPEAGAVGIASYGMDQVIANLGSIRVAVAGEDAGAAGIESYGSGEIINGGSVRAKATGETSAAAAVRAIAAGDMLRLINTEDGSIKAKGAERAAGVYLVAFDDPHGDEATVVLVNNGRIAAKANGQEGKAAGVVISDAESGQPLGAFKIVNKTDGTIKGSGDGKSVAIGVEHQDLQYRSIYVWNDGELIGDVDLGNGYNYVELRENSTVRGDINLGGGDSKVVLWAGAELGLEGHLDGVGGENNILILRGNAPGTPGDLRGKDVYNFSAIDIESGMWSLSPDHMQNSETTVGEGATLDLGGDVLKLEQGTTLGGSGTIAGTVNNEVGVVSPGHSPGTLTITADYIHGEDATYLVDVSGDEDDETSYDRLVVGDVADLQGGTVQVNPEGSLVDHRGTNTYTILKADTLTGEFAEAKGVQARAFLAYALDHDHDGGEVTLTVTGLDFSDLAVSVNEKVVTGVLDKMLDETPSAPLVEALYSVATPQDARSAYNQLTGEVYTAHPLASTLGMNRFVQAVQHGLASPAAADMRQGWFSGYGTSATLKAHDGYAEADLKVGGGTAGLTVMNGPWGRLGLTAGFAHTTVEMDARNSRLDGYGHQLGAYGEYDLGSVRLTGVVAHGWTEYDSERRIAFGTDTTIDETAEAQFETRHFVAAVRGEMVRDRASNLVPEFGLAWHSQRRQKFSEAGADEVGLQVDKYKDSYVQGDFGLRWTLGERTTRGGWFVKPVLRAAWMHDFSSPDRDVTVRFQDRPNDPMTIGGGKPGKSGLQVAFDLQGQRGEEGHLAWNVTYEGEFRSQMQVHAIVAGLNYQF